MLSLNNFNLAAAGHTALEAAMQRFLTYRSPESASSSSALAAN